METHRSMKASLDTRGSPALAAMAGRPVALVLMEPTDPGDYGRLQETVSSVFREILTPNPVTNQWNGQPLRVVLTHRNGDLWNLCMGLESEVDRWLSAPAGVVHQTGWGGLWNYWEVRLYEGYAERWQAAARSAGGVIFAMHRESGAPPAQELQAWIPITQVMVRDSAGRLWPQ